MSETEFRFRSEEDASAAETGVELPSEDIPAPEDIPATETEVSFRLDDPPVAQAGPSAVLGPKKELARLATRRMRSHANSAGPVIPSWAIAKRRTAQSHSLSTVLPRYKAFPPHKAAPQRRWGLKPAAGKMSWWIMDPQ